MRDGEYADFIIIHKNKLIFFLEFLKVEIFPIIKSKKMVSFNLKTTKKKSNQTS